MLRKLVEYCEIWIVNCKEPEGRQVADSGPGQFFGAREHIQEAWNIRGSGASRTWFLKMPENKRNILSICDREKNENACVVRMLRVLGGASPCCLSKSQSLKPALHVVPPDLNIREVCTSGLSRKCEEQLSTAFKKYRNLLAIIIVCIFNKELLCTYHASNAKSRFPQMKSSLFFWWKQ